MANLTIVVDDQLLQSARIKALQQQQLSIWDALVVTAAIEARCDVLFTEDLQSGRPYGDLEVVNPFQPGAHETAPPAPRPRARRPVASRSQRL